MQLNDATVEARNSVAENPSAGGFESLINGLNLGCYK